MAEQRLLRVFISSPIDVRPERLIAERVVQRMNQEFINQFRVESVMWERQPLVATSHFQKEITQPSETDIVVVILWSRLGFPLPVDRFPGPITEKEVTGTEWEFEDALKAARESARNLPDLLMYHKKAGVTVSLEDDAVLEECRDQKRRLQEFINTWFMDQEGKVFKAAYREFSDTVAFEEMLEEHLRELLRRRVRRDDELGAPAIRWHEGSPFRGLLSYDLKYAPVFFGRTRARSELRESLLKKIDMGKAFILVMGASGSGKSSLVKAGLVSDLLVPGMIGRVGVVRHAIFRPSEQNADLVKALATAILSKTALPEMQASPLNETIDGMSSLLRKSPDLAVRQIQKGLEVAGRAAGLTENGEARLLVVVDQLEEMFTCDAITLAEREIFVVALESLASSGFVWVVATMRSDFFERLSQQPRLARLSVGARYLLVPPEPSEMAQIIVLPAREAGLKFEKGISGEPNLDDVIRMEAAGDPGTLPLLSFLMEQLWQRRNDYGVLTFGAYQALGGLKGALGKQAEQVFTALPPVEQAEFATVLRALVSVSGGKSLARSAPLAFFEPGTPRRALVDALLGFDARLLVVDGDVSGARVWLAHESLLTHWSRAYDQIAKDARDLELRDRLEQAAERWRKAAENKKDQNSLLLASGLPLQEALVLVKGWGEELSAEIRSYIRDSQQMDMRRKIFLVAGGVGAMLSLPLIAGSVWALMVWLGVHAVEDEMEFAPIPSGSFLMGSPDTELDRASNEGPVHEVSVLAFDLGKYEVTQEQWSKVMVFKNNPSSYKGDKLPVEMVSWDDAQDFVKHMNRFGKNAYRLPSEAEWEYSARAGKTTPWYFGDDQKEICKYANVADEVYKEHHPDSPKNKKFADCSDTENHTSTVGRYKPNGFKLYDMSGNVAEWVSDCVPSKSGDTPDAYGSESAEGSVFCGYVFRGGSWRSSPDGVRSAKRLMSNGVAKDATGFRLVRYKK